ncbi:MAG TPA: LamG-like jellyroll fold domain-containing protein [Verrucomicrobiae bacterium]|nr:LamG-like jellyroll fold domain-containing protein [Verrucomicrobiae bacterium]
MKAIIQSDAFARNPICRLTRVVVVAGFLLGASDSLAQLLPPIDVGPTNAPLDSWSFYDRTNWTSDLGYPPVSFTNLTDSLLGDFLSLVVDTNVPAWLQYNVYENDGTTNLTVNQGSVTFWFAPNWSSIGDTNGGFGPQEWGRLLEVGAYTTNSSYGWWSIYVDPAGTNLYFSAQTNDLSDSYTTFLSTPIDWTTNYFHFIALTYSATNTTLYLDGALVTNGAPVTIYPGADVLADGFYLGSDSSGIYQAHGLFDILETYNYPLDSNDVEEIFEWEHPYYQLNPFNTAMEIISSAPSTPAYIPSYNAISGPGYLQWVTNVSDCVSSTNVWITNVVATAVGSGTNVTMNLTFTIEGGVSGAPYDVFANSILDFSSDTNKAWAWMGQGYQCNTYTLTNLPPTTCFLILGTPQDSDGDGLTDAYERLTSKTDLNNYDTDGDGISDSDEVLSGTDPRTPNSAIPSSLDIETCPQ